MALYRDQVVRVSIRDIRMRYRPKEFSALKSVVLEHAGVTARVYIVKMPAPSCRGGYRRWIRCPSCGECVNLVGLVPGADWGCAACRRWRGRSRSRVG